MSSGEERANRFVLLLLGLQRLSYLVPTVFSTTSTQFHDAGLNAVLVGVTVGWNVFLVVQVRRRGWISERLAWIDVAWTALMILTVTANLPAEYEHDSLNWTGRLGQAGAALAGVAIARLRTAAVAVLVLLTAHTVSVVLHTADAGDLPAKLAGCLNGIIWFAVILRFAHRYLRRQGRRLDELTAAQVAADSRQAAENARYDARLAHHRALHDTVLTTLVAVSRGGLDHRTEQVRERCARDAEYIRRLLSADPPPAGSLEDKLTEVIAGARALGLQVHRQVEPVDGLAPEVVQAFGEAAREALNNVLKHAGTGTAWVTVTGNGAVVLRVVDRGSGFEPGTARPGLGLAGSIRDRMSDVGGAARVTSEPGEGTCVELAWPA